MQRRGLLAAGAALCGDGREALYELSVGNPDKGALALDDARRRVAQFTEAGLPLVVTQVFSLRFDILQYTQICHVTITVCRVFVDIYFACGSRISM